MELNIRKVGVADIIPVVSILKKLDYKGLVKKLGESELAARKKAAGLTDEQKQDDSVALEFGVEMFMPAIDSILESLPAIEKPLYAWLANMCGMKEKDFYAAPPAIVPDIIFGIIHQEEFTDFFKAVRKFLG